MGVRSAPIHPNLWPETVALFDGVAHSARQMHHHPLKPLVSSG